MFKKCLLLCFALVFTASAVSASADYAPNEVLVKWNNVPASVGVSTIRVSDVETAVELFSADPNVAYAEPNYYRYLAAVPDDTYYTSQWHLEQSNDVDIDAEAAWDISTGSRNIVVAVIDTGMDMNHPDLMDNLWTNSNEVASNGVDDDGNGYIDDVNGWDFYENDNDPSSHPTSSSPVETYVLHGTHVAGIIGATGNNATGVTGVNWEVSIMPLRIFSDEGDSTIDIVAEAAAYAVANGANVINMSYGGYSNSATERTAMANAAAAGVVLVAAAGNDTIDLNSTPSYPICYDDVIGVGATDADGFMAYFSNYGDDCVDVAAPGDTILSTYYTDDDVSLGYTEEYGYMSGTSMATPVVSGLAALLLSIDTTLTNNETTSLLIANVDDLGISELGSGQVNADLAATAAEVQTRPSAVATRAYHADNRRREISASERTKDGTPYFHWAEPTSDEAVAGYYVYFGRNRLNPFTEGVLQTNRSYTPADFLRGNERQYRLRIKTVDAIGQLSNLSEFVYLVDRRVQRPTWNSVSAVAGPAVNLRWYKPSGEHVVGYQVYRSQERDRNFETISGVITTKRFHDDTVENGERYYYKVRAIDDLGNESPLSAVRTIRL